MRKTLHRVFRFWREDHGQDLAEYALLIAFLATGAVALMSQLGASIKVPWNTAGATLTAAQVATAPTAPPPPPKDDDH